jgi:hypothetical protein
MYAPSLGLAIVVATLLDFLEGALSRRAIPARVGHAALAVLLVAGMVLGCVAMIGIQAAFQARSRDDRALAAALKQAAPDPAPGAMLLVLEDARAAVRTGARRFDGALLSPLSLQGSATPYIRWMYGRNDLHAAQITSWAPPTVAEVAADGVALLGLEPAFPMGIEPRSDGAVLVPWSRLLTLCIDPKGGVHLAREGPLRCGTVGRGPS